MIRRIFAGSIVALLLSVSSLAAACDVSCAFASMNSDCHSQQTESQASEPGSMKMDGMAMAGMAMPEMGSGNIQQTEFAATHADPGHPSIGEMGPCEKQACDSSVSITAKTSCSVDAHFHFSVAVADTPNVDGTPPLFHDVHENVSSDIPRHPGSLPVSLRI